MRTLLWNDIHNQPLGLHCARACYNPGQRFALHDHDFAELFWVESGEIIHHTMEKAQRCKPGDLLLIEPQHRHGFEALSQPGVFINLAFHADTLHHMRASYGNDPQWTWPASETPLLRQLDHHDRQACTNMVTNLPTQIKPWQRDQLLLSILSRCRLPNQGRWANCPAWLQQGLEELEQKGDFTDALGDLTHTCGRTREHVAREIRRCLHKRPVDIINTLRMELAAKLIGNHGYPLAEVVKQVGLRNRAHFHRLFQSHHGCSPAQYRRQSQLTVR